MSRQLNLSPFVDRLTSRSVLTEVEKDFILGLPFRVKHPRLNQDFVGLGQKVDHACYVVSGLVGHFDQTSCGARQITALHIPGDMPGLQSLVQPRTTNALQALSDCTILEIPHVALRSLKADHPAIAEAFWRDCMADTMILAQWLVNVGRRNAMSRLAHLLCEMAYRYKAIPVKNEVRFELPMTQRQLADATGLSPIHLNRTLRGLMQIGTTFRNKLVQIDDWDALAEVGDFDHHYLQDELTGNRMRLTG